MRKTIKATVSTVSAVLTLSALPAWAERDAWELEFTPYIWAAGLDADVEAKGRTGTVDASFSDIVDNMDLNLAFLTSARYNSWVVRAQVDYLDLDSDLERGTATGSVDSKIAMGTLGFGYQFKGWREGQTFDVLLGVRHLSLDNELKIDGVGTFESDKDFTDPIVMVQPSFPISERWRFNPIFAYGTGGDSEYTYELQPQLQFQAWKYVAFRFGYRKIYYKIEGDAGNSFDGSFQGPFIGIGATWGGSPAPQPVVVTPPPPAPVAPPLPPKDTDGDGVADTKDQCPNTPAGQRVDAIGCGFEIYVEANFDTDSATIKPESFAALDRAVKLLTSVPTMQGTIEGHTDSSGSDAHNQKLSERRAAAVTDYLVKHGIDKARVPSKGLGESQPEADNATAEGRAKNRRVVLRRSDTGN